MFIPLFIFFCCWYVAFSHRICRESIFFWEDRIYFVSLVHLRVRMCMTTTRYCWLFKNNKKYVKINKNFEFYYLNLKVKQRAKRRKLFASIYKSQSIVDFFLLLMLFFSDFVCNPSKSFRIIYWIRLIFLSVTV